MDPDLFLDEFAAAGSDSLLVHWEGNANLHRTVQRIRTLGKRAGVVINPATPAAVLEEIVQDVDQVLVMTVKDPQLENFQGRVSDSGEGRWTIRAAIDEAVPTPVLSSALYERFSSRGEADFGDKLLSAMRFEFGGHLEKPAA
jgi:6-phosphogluconate dehydrogenase